MDNSVDRPISSNKPKNKSEIRKGVGTSFDGGKHRLATIVFSDICGFTKMMGKDELRTMQIVEWNKQIHLKCIGRHRGTLIKELGDGLLTSFESAYDAVQCAKEIMEAVQAEGKYQLHMGIHLGDIIFTKEDIFGDGVNIASRINACAKEGEIIISEEVWKTIKNQPEFQTEYLGKRNLKNVEQAVKIHRVVLNGKAHTNLLKKLWYSYPNSIKAGIGLIVLAILVFMVYDQFDQYNRVNDEKYASIAVLPFENRSNDANYDYLGEGLAEEVIRELLDLSAVSVISSRSSFKFKNSDNSVQEISRDLGADILLTGTFTIVNGRIDLNVELIKGRRNEILNYFSISGNLSKIGIIATNIRSRIIETLPVSINEQVKQVDEDRKVIKAEAYRYYLMGKGAMHDNTQQKREEIIRYFQASIEIDSMYADPYIGIAEAYIFDVNRGYSSAVEASQKARQYALAAESLKPGSGEVAGIMGILHLFNFEFKKSIPYFEKSIAVSPNYDVSYQWYSFAMQVMGEFEKSGSLLQKARLLDPLNNFNDFYIIMNNIYQRNYSAAQQIIDDKLLNDPDHSQTLFIQAVLYLQQKKYQQAWEALQKRGVGLETNFIAGFTYAMLGQDDKAQLVLDNMIKTSKRSYVPPSQLATVYCGLKQYKKAVEQIEQAFLVHDPWIIWIMYLNLVDPIRQDPVVESLMGSINTN